MDDAEVQNLLDDVLNGENGDNNAMEVDEDEVVATIDVILSQELSEQLYVMQYPLRPVWRPYDNTMLDQVRFKPGSQLLEMEYKLKEEEKAKEQNVKVLSATTGQEYEDPTKQMTTHVVRSTVVPNKSNYLVGLYKNNQLHMTPLKGVLQMRPSFGYIDQSIEAKKKRKEAEAMDATAAGIRASMDDMEAEDTLKPVQIQVKKKETERATQMRMKSYAYLKQLETEESWTKLDFVHRDRMDAMAVFDSIAARATYPVSADSLSKTSYLDTINPLLSDDGNLLTQRDFEAMKTEDRTRTRYARSEYAEFKSRRAVFNQIPPSMSLHTIRQLTPNEQIAALLNNASVLTFAQVRHYSSIQDEALLLTLLEQHGVNVHGVWVVKSTKSYRHRASNIRDWVLGKIATAAPDDTTSDPNWWFITRDQVAKAANVSIDWVNNIVDPITEFVPGCGLKLKYAPDEEFKLQHPNIYKKYDSFWHTQQEALFSQMTRWIGKPETDVDEEEAAAVTMVRRPTNLLRVHQETIAPLHFNTSMDLGEALESNSLSNFARIELSLPARHQMDAFLRFAFDAYGVLSPKGLLELAKRHSAMISDAPPFTEGLAQQELGRVGIKVGKTGFAPKTLNDPNIDPFRDTIINIFKEKDAATRPELQATFREKNGKEPKRDVFTKLVKDLLVLDAKNFFHLKTGDAIEQERIV